MRLASRTAHLLPVEVVRPSYERDDQEVGIVHFGIGAFHRAHQAWYTDLAMDAGERDWAICGVSLRSASVGEELNPQDGLYTLTQRSAEGAQTRLVGAVREVLYGPEQSLEVIDRIGSLSCHIVSFTVTEKGYARSGSGNLDLGQAAGSFYPLLTEGLALRKRRGLPGITLLPCDNLADNGPALRELMAEWIAARAPDVAQWFERECTVPSTMVDRIVPRTTEVDRAQLGQRIGLQDQGAVFTEPFSQWVIEDNFAGPRPAWERHGAKLVKDVAPFETAKLRMLNGAHSLLAYAGLRKGYDFVHEAIADPQLAALTRRLMLDEAAPTVPAASGQDLPAYADELLDRFANPALEHRLAQIAMDGTEKIPQRWLDTLRWHLALGDRCPAILEGLDAWHWHVCDGRFVDDPRGDFLRSEADGDAAVLIARCFGKGVGSAFARGRGGKI